MFSFNNVSSAIDFIVCSEINVFTHCFEVSTRTDVVNSWFRKYNRYAHIAEIVSIEDRIWEEKNYKKLVVKLYENTLYE